MRGEFDLIADFFARLTEGAPGAFHCRNDAAVLDLEPGYSMVITVDTLVESVHFFADDPAGLVARKLLRVNLSDLAAMGARPLAYVIAASYTERTDDAWILAFADGLSIDQNMFSVVLLGGDTVKTPGPLTFSLTAFGAVPQGKALTRDSARPGDLVYVSGTLGDSALGLKFLRGELTGLDEEVCIDLVGRYRLPRPRLALGQALIDRNLATTAIDISDGLMADAGHIAETSKVAIEITAEALPLSNAARSVLIPVPDLQEFALTGGDDYELLFTVNPEQVSAIEALAEALDLPLTAIGYVKKGTGVCAVDDKGRAIPLSGLGWTHF